MRSIWSAIDRSHEQGGGEELVMGHLQRCSLEARSFAPPYGLSLREGCVGNWVRPSHPSLTDRD